MQLLIVLTVCALLRSLLTVCALLRSPALLPTMASRKRSRASWDVSDEEEAASATAQRAAGKLLLDHLMGLHASCKLTAEDLCVACYHAQAAGTPGGDFADLAKANACC